jgi:hypothetical protein
LDEKCNPSNLKMAVLCKGNLLRVLDHSRKEKGHTLIVEKEGSLPISRKQHTTYQVDVLLPSFQAAEQTILNKSKRLNFHLYWTNFTQFPDVTKSSLNVPAGRVFIGLS